MAPPPHRSRRRPSRRRRRRRWAIAAIVVPLLAVALAYGALLARDALSLDDDLRLAQTKIEQGRRQIGDGDIEAAQATLEKARIHVARASSRTNRLIWRTAQRVPIAGRTLNAMSEVVNLTDRGLRFGRDLISSTSALLDENASDLAAINGRISLAPIREAARSLDEIEPAAVQQAIADVDDLNLRFVPAEIKRAVHESARLGRDVLEAFDNSRELLRLLPAMLGDDEPREYFLAMQNPAELRGSGGFLGFFATVRVHEGRFTLGRTQSYTALSEQGFVPSQPLGSPEFEARYGRANASTFLANANVDPDLPTTAQTILTLFEASRGVRLDGVIVVDPLALEGILEVIGPVELPRDVAPRGLRLPNPVTGATVAKAILIDEYEVFGGRAPERDDWLEAVAAEVFEQLFDRTWDPSAMASRLARLGGEGRFQLYSARGPEQDVLERLRVGGTLRSVEGQDLIGVSANNIAANKADVHVAHEQDLRVHLVPDGNGEWQRSADLTVTVTNPLPTSGMDVYIIGSSPVTGRREAVGTGRPGLTRTWFSVWAPPDALFVEVRDRADIVPTGVWRIHGARVVDHVLEVESESTGSFTSTWSGNAHVVETDGELVYTLRWWRQAKAIPDRISATIDLPAGTRLLRAEVIGGGIGGDGFGPHGEQGPRVTTTIVGNVVTVTGDMTADVVIELHFERIN